MKYRKKKELTFRGIGVYPGIGIGRISIIRHGKVEIPKYQILKPYVGYEIRKFQKALDNSKEQIEEILSKIDAKHQKEVYSILEIQKMFLNDSTLMEKIKKLIVEEQINAEWAVEKVVKEMEQFFEKINDPYIRERKEDLYFVANRLIRNLKGEEKEESEEIIEREIISSHDLSPIEVVRLSKEGIKGIIVEVGGKNSHTSITIRTLEIPAVVGVEDFLSHAESGDKVIVDGVHGVVILNPTERMEEKYRELKEEYEKKYKELKHYIDVTSVTKDGKEITLMANVEFLEEISAVLSHKAEGIGLFRTEFLFLNRDTPPSEEEQFLVYKEVAEKLAPHPVTIRTFDLGADKKTPFHLYQEENPALGLRGVRLSLEYREIFKAQLRAILRAGEYGNVRIMLPMVSGVWEIRRVNKLLNEIKKELKEEGIPFKEDTPLGAMIEVPSAAIISDLLAKEVDFFSVGTNDLVQYTLAVDRTNEHVEYLFEPLHPAILRLLNTISDNARKAGIEVSICGEMAGDPRFTAILVGMGYTSLSMIPHSILKVKKVIREISQKEARELVQKLLLLETAKKVEEVVKKFIDEKLSFLYELE